MAQELEIKLTLNEDAMDAALAWLNGQPQAVPGPVKMLENTYYDTPEAGLNKQKAALRIRQKGNVYIQTVKTQGRFIKGMHQREEWEWPLAGAGLDLELLRGTPLRNSVDLAALTPVFETNFTRRIVMIDDGDAVIECALDSGVVVAGRQERQLNEVEFELKSGNPQGLLVWAARLAEECAVFVNLISKAEQGYYLAGLYSPISGAKQPDVVTEFFRQLGVVWLTGTAVNLDDLDMVELGAIAQNKSAGNLFQRVIDQLRGGSTLEELMTSATLGQVQLALLR